MYLMEDEKDNCWFPLNSNKFFFCCYGNCKLPELVVKLDPTLASHSLTDKTHKGSLKYETRRWK